MISLWIYSECFKKSVSFLLNWRDVKGGILMDSSEKKLCWQYMLTSVLFNNKFFFGGGGQNFRICLLRIVYLTLFTIIWIANVKFAIEPFIMLYKSTGTYVLVYNYIYQALFPPFLTETYS